MCDLFEPWAPTSTRQFHPPATTSVWIEISSLKPSPHPGRERRSQP
jgi:hypothetical protein